MSLNTLQLESNNSIDNFVETTIQMLHDEGVFHTNDNKDEILKADVTFKERTGSEFIKDKKNGTIFYSTC